MAENSKIEWTDATWNPVGGCTRVDEGCRNCYAETEASTLRAEKAGGHWPRPMVTLRDRQPEKPAEGMLFVREGIGAPAEEQAQ